MKKIGLVMCLGLLFLFSMNSVSFAQIGGIEKSKTRKIKINTLKYNGKKFGQNNDGRTVIVNDYSENGVGEWEIASVGLPGGNNSDVDIHTLTTTLVRFFDPKWLPECYECGMANLSMPAGQNQRVTVSSPASMYIHHTAFQPRISSTGDPRTVIRIKFKPTNANPVHLSTIEMVQNDNGTLAYKETYRRDGVLIFAIGVDRPLDKNFELGPLVPTGLGKWSGYEPLKFVINVPLDLNSRHGRLQFEFERGFGSPINELNFGLFAIGNTTRNP